MHKQKAVLIIHGFAGGTYDEESLSNLLQLDKNLKVFSFTLPGHASTSIKATKEEWIKSSVDHLNVLIENKYKEIYIIGHSMGGLIAAYLASKNHKEVKKLVLAAPAFKYVLSDGKVMDLLKKTPEIMKDYSPNTVVGRSLKVPLKTLNEFIKIVKENQDVTKNITIPVLIIHGLKDMIVPKSASEYVYETVKSKYKKILFFKNSGHNLFKGPEQNEINKKIKMFLLLKEKSYDKFL